ncbi:beta-lactamase family protein [Plantactinospora sp. S1510]|uniref:Beta-lactamase family protein n=1 Tax=Plantactinospora alkalitolerans TaxID=2789879 RepID=A0ABS0GQQ0_9ACTN|nr:serine hydrolase domain-containing protein [Plantactinospora alkalitolerans]MBF9128490.1 beta-lactamase family protein [Plantactinospora alkalitolerans]
MTARRTILRAGAAGALALTVGTATGTPAAAARRTARPRTGPDPVALQTALDGIAAGAASGVLAEVRHSARVWRGSSGAAELGTTRPVRVDGRFRAGSITKSFVATVLLQLAGERRLALGDPIERWLPGVVSGGDRITLHHLLQHTSGIVDYTRTAQFRQLYGTVEGILATRYRTWTPHELLAFITGTPPLFEPGTSYRYSNTNYILLALVIERVTGNHYATEVQRRILRPLGLAGTELPGIHPYIAGPHSHGYLPVQRDGTYQPVDITAFNPSAAGASGELLTSAADLNRFYRALLTGRLLRPAQLAQMKTSWSTGARADYGLGLQTRRLATGTTVWGHGGEIFGYEAASWSTEDGTRQLTVAVNPWGEGDLHALIDDLLAVAFRQP